MNLNSMLRDMGLVDAFSTTLGQVEIEIDPGDCSSGCETGCLDGCNGGCNGGCKTSKKA